MYVQKLPLFCTVRFIEEKPVRIKSGCTIQRPVSGYNFLAFCTEHYCA